MGQKSVPTKEPADQVIKGIRRATRRENLYYRRSKEFLEAGKRRLAGDTVRTATT